MLFQPRKRIENVVYQSGSRLIGWFGIFLIILYAFIILTRVDIVAFNAPPHNIFSSLGWIAAMLAGYIAYVGFCLPEWYCPAYWWEHKSKGITDDPDANFLSHSSFSSIRIRY